MGNPHVVHSIKYNKNEFNAELYLRWMQLMSVFPHARIDLSILNSLTSNNSSNINIKESINNSIKLRYSLSLYLYSYFIKMSLEGGSLIRPLFLIFNSKSYSLELMNLDNQFMLGSNLMINPIFKASQSIKSTFFPKEPFYDLLTGNLLNISGEGFYNINIDLINLGTYLRGGCIIPFQAIPDFFKISNISSMKLLPVQIYIALDSTFSSTGRIFFDNGYSNDSIIKKLYYKMEISSSYSHEIFNIIFHVYSTKYTPSEKEYPFIDRISIYGYTKFEVRKVSIVNKKLRYDLNPEFYTFEFNKKILILKNLQIKFDIDTRIILV